MISIKIMNFFAGPIVAVPNYRWIYTTNNNDVIADIFFWDEKYDAQIFSNNLNYWPVATFSTLEETNEWVISYLIKKKYKYIIGHYKVLL